MLFRSVFAGFPLMMAVRLVRSRGQAVTRESLRATFYAQCYPVAAFALALNIGIAVERLGVAGAGPAGLGIIAAALAYYVGVQARWFAVQLRTGAGRALGCALRGLAEAFAQLLGVGFLFTR